MYDIIIIGAGPAGLTAAIYSARANKRVLCIDKGSFGGQITFSPKIENYPAFSEISGTELADKILEHALSLGVEVEIDTITGIEREKGGSFKVNGNSQTYEGCCVIIAAGAAHRKLGIENEDKYIGNGISFCAVCDGAFYKEKDIILVGGGNSAMQEAVLLSDVCRSVTMVQNLDCLTGEEALKKKIAGRDNISVIYNSTVCSLLEENQAFAGVIINCGGEEKALKADGMFVAIGLSPENQPFSLLAELDNSGYIISDENCTTKTPGLFVAGDCRTKRIRQIATAIADGASAAVAACRYSDSATNA